MSNPKPSVYTKYEKALGLLAWAVDFVTVESEQLRRSYLTPDGSFSDEDVAVTIAAAERWLAQARETLK